MLVRLHRKGFEASLVDRAGPSRFMVGMPALRMGDGHPAEHFGEFSIMTWPEEHVPVIRLKQWVAIRMRNWAWASARIVSKAL